MDLSIGVEDDCTWIHIIINSRLYIIDKYGYTECVNSFSGDRYIIRPIHPLKIIAGVFIRYV